MSDARKALREADAAFQSAPLPAQSLARLRTRVLDEPRRSRSLLWLAVPALVALLAFVFWPRPLKPLESEDIRLVATQQYERGRVHVTANGAALLHRDRDALAVRSGEIEVSVVKGPERVRIAVSHGEIEVVGTRFTIRQRDDGGDVTLHEGVIHFISAKGTRVLKPGETVEWPEREEPALAPTPEPAPPPQAKKVVRPRSKEPAVIHETDAAWLLEEVDVLRSRGEYPEAVRLLDKGLGGLVSSATRERFSFELGSILSYQVGDRTRACAHWEKHRASFKAGRYAREVEAAREKVQCE